MRHGVLLLLQDGLSVMVAMVLRIFVAERLSALVGFQMDMEEFGTIRVILEANDFISLLLLKCLHTIMIAIHGPYFFVVRAIPTDFNLVVGRHIKWVRHRSQLVMLEVIKRII